jgi:hypothetical protein
MARTKWEEIPPDEVLKLAKLGCTNGEIGDFFGVSDETIRTRFLDVLALGRANQKISLRRYQWKSAKSGSVPMQIHLGKQYLGQSEKVEHSGNGASPIAFDASVRSVAGDEYLAWREKMAAMIPMAMPPTGAPSNSPNA